MPAPDVLFGFPLTRLNPWYPGQMGVPGAWTDTGLRTHCTGTVFYVSPNHPAASDLRDGTDPNDPLLTITAAVQRCESFRGDVIAVMPHSMWEYSPRTPYGTRIAEEVTLDKHGVRLVGVTPGSLGVYWEPASNGGTQLTVTGIDCVVEGFCFHEGDTYTGCTAIHAVWDGVAAYGENLTVRHCAFMDTVDNAIRFDYTWYCHVHHCLFWECDAYGLYSDSGGVAPTEDPPDYLHVHDCIFHDIGTAAIWLPGLSRGYIQHNKVYNSAAQGAGAATNAGFVTNDGTVAGSENTVSQNVFSCQNTAVAAGDYGDLNNGSTTDNWTHSYCMNGLAYGIP